MSIDFPYCPKGYVVPTERTCDVCGITKPMAGFYERPERPPWKHSHWHSTCRECLLKRKHARYHADIEASRATRVRQLRNQKANRNAMGCIVPREDAQRRRDEKNLRTYRRTLLRDGMPIVGRNLSFSQRAAIRRIQEGGARLMRSLVLEHKSGRADAKAERAAAVWANMSLTMAERQRLLAKIRSDDE